VSDRLRVLKEASRNLLSTRIIVLGVVAACGWTVYRHPPVESIARQEVGVRLNRLTGTSTRLGEGIALALPGIHEIRRYSLQDQTYAPTRSSKADGEAPFQSSEGLSLGVEHFGIASVDRHTRADGSLRSCRTGSERCRG